MQSNTQNRTDQHEQAFDRLTASEMAAVEGGRTVILDGATVELPDHTIAMMINSGAVRSVTFQHPLGAVV